MTSCRELFDRPPDEPLQRLTPDGELLVDDLETVGLSTSIIREMYAHMRLARRFDERALSLQRQGRLGTFPSLAGQEAIQVASTYALTDDDWIAYQYREHGAVTVRGEIQAYLAYWMGHEYGNEAVADVNVFPLNISIGSHVPHVVGMGMAANYRDEETVFLAHFGDGATSEGDVHEAMNFAGVFDTPTIFCCNNNQWAISVPRERQTASSTIAGKAAAYGFHGIQVDGMDPIAVYEVTKAAAEKARAVDSGSTRPTLIETLTYRYGAHTTADDPSVYRDDEEVERWKDRDPIDRLERYLRSHELLEDEELDALESGIETEVEVAVEFAESVAADPDAMFEHVYDQPTPRIDEQRGWLHEFRERHDDEELLGEDLL